MRRIEMGEKAAVRLGSATATTGPVVVPLLVLLLVGKNWRGDSYNYDNCL